MHQRPAGQLAAGAGGGDPDANFVYAADSACVDTVFCAGRVLMRGRRVADEAAILADARRAAESLRRAAD